MLEKNNYIELFVNGEGVEFDSQDSINIRINDIVFDPTKIETTQATYSYEFSLPCTAKNNKIFDYANNLSRLDKFHKRWNAQLYADGSLIFDGSMALRGVEDGYYQCNLVNYKIDTIEDIFGDAVLSDIPWEMEFNGVETINECNSADTSTVTFPFVSYGAFQKMPYNSDEVAQDYTSKYVLDQYNLWYIESFPPSINPIELIKKAYEWKGYKVQGDALRDYFLNNIFMSMSLADGQDPLYNLGNPRFGKVDITVNWENPMDTSGDSGETFGTVQELQHPYFLINNPDATTSPEWASEWSRVKLGENENLVSTEPQYNFDKIRVYDMLLEQDGGSYTINDPTYLFNPVEHCIFIPTDGFYKITLDYHAILESYADITAKQLVRYYNMFNGYNASFGAQEEDIPIKPNIATTTPIEIQLVRNYDENIELIKGYNNLIVVDGMPNNTTVSNQGQAPNYVNFTSAFPHEPWGKQLNDIALPYNENDTKISPWANFHLDKYMTKWEYPTDKKTDNVTYYPRATDVMAYDPAVSPIFIAGGTSMGNMQGNGTNAVIKNGYSWSRSVSERTDNFYNNNGYIDLTVNNGDTYNYKYTNWNKNSLQGAPNDTFMEATASYGMSGNLSCVVKLNKNDKLQLFAVHRDYQTKDGDSVSYQSSANCHVVIEAISPKSMQQLKKENFNWNSPIDFDVNLKLGNFLNKETKISDWINDFCNAFNLETSYYNNTVSFDKRTNSIGQAVVDIDDRANTENAKSSIIDYPKEMAVKYKIDEEEHGFYASVPSDKIEEEDWKKYGDYGYTVIQLNDDAYVSTKEEKQLNYSYCWYDNFNWIPIGRNHEDTGDLGDEQTLTIPVISKEEWMIDGYDYAESMKHDGFGLTQRFWYRPTIDSMQAPWVWTDTYPQEKIWLYTTRNVDKGLYLSYKTNEYSLLKNYFNIKAELSSNYVEVDVYLTPDEYNMLKNGSLVRFDKDLYSVVEINGYDAANNNMTTLKLMKKTTPMDYVPVDSPVFNVKYRWVLTDGYACSGTTKMSRGVKQQTIDDGVTWYDVIPREYKAIEPVIEEWSIDCGYVPLERWTLTDGYECSGFTKMSQEKLQLSYDNGTTWVDSDPLQTRAGYPIQYLSEDCGYEPTGYETHYFTLVAVTSGELGFTPRYRNNVEGSERNIYYYSTDNGASWTSANTYVPINVSVGDKVLFKGNMTNGYEWVGGYIPSPANGCGYFSSNDTTRYAAEGNPMSLIYGDDFIGKTSLPSSVKPNSRDVALINLFANSHYSQAPRPRNYSLVSIDNIALVGDIFGQNGLFSYCANLTSIPSTLFSRCGGKIWPVEWFKGCTSLASIPTDLFSYVTISAYLKSMFEGCTSLTDISGLVFPQNYYDTNEVPYKNFESMFKGCTSLTKAPMIPYSYLGGYQAYTCQYMFSGCTSLTTPMAELPATSVGDCTYREMFKDCTSLTATPIISAATVMGHESYESMFEGCTSLTTLNADMLPSCALEYGCYFRMFFGCTSLRTIPNNFLKQVIQNTGLNYTSMFEGCTALTTPMDYIPPIFNETYGESLNCLRMFANCTSLTTIPTLGTSTTDADFREMFQGCTSLTSLQSGKLPSTLASGQNYMQMFQGCTSLTTISNGFLPSTTLGSGCYQYMFEGCTSLTTVPKLPATSLVGACYYEMFKGCTSLATVPTDMLPATTLASVCYQGMFKNCTSLAKSPTLPAETLDVACYKEMFYACSSLNEITIFATDISANSCTDFWIFGGVAANGTFNCKSSAGWEYDPMSGSRYKGIPSGWNVVYI